MNHTLLLLIGLAVYPGVSSAGGAADEKYKVSSIPAELLNNADAIIRHEVRNFTVTSSSRARLGVHRIITILNPAGKHFGEVELGYDKFLKVDLLDGRIYDSDGKKIRALSSADVSDYSDIQDYSLYDESRVRIATLHHHQYPYTIEWTYEIVYSGLINWAFWYPEETRASVEYSRFEVVVPTGTKVRYQGKDFPEPAVTQSGRKSTYVWEAGHILPFEPEPVGPAIMDQYRSVKIAPAEFSIDGFEGDLSSWQSFGEWFYRLQNGRQNIPESVRKEVVALTSNLSDWREKVRALYEYLQRKTRYVNVQLGIGGWQPFDASYVCERGYGDCKALTNYMLSLLKVVDIPAYPVLIYSGTPRREINPDFPMNQFNHVILAVPERSDTIWLECTSQNIPFGHIGQNNENRFALLVTSIGGTLVRTPASSAEENQRVRTASVKLFSVGSAQATIRSEYSGNQQDYVRHGLKDATPQEREQWLTKHIQIPSFNLQSVDYSGIGEKLQAVHFTCTIQLPRFMSVAGKRLLFKPNLLERRSYVPKELGERKHAIIHSYPYLDVDSITYAIPEGWSVEALPQRVTIERPFAHYESGVSEIKPGVLLYTRRVLMTAAELPPKMYSEYRSFFKEVAQADQATAVLVDSGR